MSAAADDPLPYRLTLTGNVPEDIKRLAKRAATRGKKEAYLEAWLAIEKRLAADPNQFGEYRYSLQNGDLRCHIGAIQPVAVQFAVYEQGHEVFVLKAFLLGS